MAFYSPHGRGRIHHLAENDQDWVAHFYQIKGNKRNVFWNDNSIQLDRACGPCPWRGPMYSKPQKTPGFADRLNCSGRGRVTHFVWGNEPRRPNPSLPLPSLLGSPRLQVPGEPKVWPTLDYVTGNFGREDAYWCQGLGLHRWASCANLIRQLYHIFLFSSSSQPAEKPKHVTTNPV